MGKPKPTLEALRAEVERQNKELAAFEAALEGVGAIEIPPAFFEAFDDACEVRRVAPASQVTFTYALRA